MISMQALDTIYLPKTAKEDDFYGIQSQETNNNRLNSNFRKVATAIVDIYSQLDGVVDKVLAEIPTADAYVSDVSGDGNWAWRKWSDTLIEAWITTLTAVVNCTTAYGSLYGAQTTISLPASLFASISAINITPICSANVVFVSIVSVTASTITVKVLTTASASVSVQFGIHVFGK